MKDKNFIAIDFETANAKRNSICSLGICVVKDLKIVETRHWLIKPVGSFSTINTRIHGISEKNVVNKPKFDDLWETIYPYLNNSIMASHNIAFDFSVLNKTIEFYGLKEANIVDRHCSLKLSRKMIPNLASYRLPVIANLLNIKLNHHYAESDAIACAKIIIYLFKQTQSKKVLKLNQDIVKDKLKLKEKD